MILSMFLSDLENKIVDFGKYNGLTFKDLVSTDSEYAQTLFDNEGFQSDHPDLYTYLSCQGYNKTQAPHPQLNLSSSKKPLTRNQIQALFIDNDRILQLAQDALGEQYDYTIVSKTFEDTSNTDLVVELFQKDKNSIFNFTKGDKVYLLINIKTVMSDDYPNVLKELRKYLYMFRLQRNCTDITKQVLLLQNYTGSISLNDVKTMFGDISIEEL